MGQRRQPARTAYDQWAQNPAPVVYPEAIDGMLRRINSVRTDLGTLTLDGVPLLTRCPQFRRTLATLELVVKRCADDSIEWGEE